MLERLLDSIAYLIKAVCLLSFILYKHAIAIVATMALQKVEFH